MIYICILQQILIHIYNMINLPAHACTSNMVRIFRKEVYASKIHMYVCTNIRACICMFPSMHVCTIFVLCQDTRYLACMHTSAWALQAITQAINMYLGFQCIMNVCVPWIVPRYPAIINKSTTFVRTQAMEHFLCGTSVHDKDFE